MGKLGGLPTCLSIEWVTEAADPDYTSINATGQRGWGEGGEVEVEGETEGKEEEERREKGRKGKRKGGKKRKR